MSEKSKQFRQWCSERMGHPYPVQLAKSAIEELEDKRHELELEKKQLQQDKSELIEALTNVLHAESHNTGYEPSLSVFHRYVDEALQLLERIK